MEIITMESSAYRELVDKIERIAVYVRKSEEAKSDTPDVWLDNREVMSLLGISKRTLQRMRENKQIGYAIFSGTCRYHFSEVERLVSDSTFNFNARTLDEFKQNYRIRTASTKNTKR